MKSVPLATLNLNPLADSKGYRTLGKVKPTAPLELCPAIHSFTDQVFAGLIMILALVSAIHKMKTATEQHSTEMLAQKP